MAELSNSELLILDNILGFDSDTAYDSAISDNTSAYFDNDPEIIQGY